MTGFHTFVKKQEAITFPKQPLNLGNGFSAEKKQGVRDK